MPIPLAVPIALAAAGAGLSGAGALWGQNKEKNEQFPTLAPEQIAAQNALLQEVLSGLKDPMAGPFGFGGVEQQARSQFQQRTIPSIAQRFAGADAQRGSGFQQALGTAGSGLDESLAAMRANYNLQRLSQLGQLSHIGMQPRFEWAHTPASPNAFGRFAGTVGPALMSMGTFGALGGFGKGEDTNKLSMLMSLFGGGSPMGGVGMQGPQSSYYKSHPQEFFDLYKGTSFDENNLMKQANLNNPLSSEWLDALMGKFRNLQDPYRTGPKYQPGSPYMFNTGQQGAV